MSRDEPFLGSRAYDPATKTYGGYTWQTYSEVVDRITRFGSGLLHIRESIFAETAGQQQQSPPARQWTLGIWAINRPEWTIAGEACSAYGLVSVGLYSTLGPDAVEYCLNHSECAIAVASADLVPHLIRNKEKLPLLKAIICMDSLKGGPAVPGMVSPGPVLRDWAKDKGLALYDWDEVEALGVTHPRPHAPAKPEDLYTICYTSGTTGTPKGAMVTHRNLIAVLAQADSVTPLYQHDTTISFLPLPHIFGRLVELFLFSTGGRIGYGCGDTLLLLDDLAQLQPTFLPAVPRLLNRVYAKVQQATVLAPGLLGMLARRGLATKLANLEAGLGNRHGFWDFLLFSKVRKALGGRVRLVLTGSAPITAEVLAFLRVAFCCEVIEGFGQTEGAGAGTNTEAGEVTAGHVGAPAACNELKLIDVPELNYLSTDKPHPRGEICLRGANVISGYFKDTLKTNEAIDAEGWLHTSDVGQLNANGTITIIDRVKNVFKLAQGEFVAVEKIENTLATALPWIQQIFVHGDRVESSLVAIVVPEPDVFGPFAQKTLRALLVAADDDDDNGAAGHAREGRQAEVTALLEQLENKDNNQGWGRVYQHPAVRKAVVAELDRVGRAGGLKGFEIPKNVYLESEAFSIDNGRLTPTFKIKRQPVVEEYRRILTELYEEKSTKI
ncbi:hypothetical protein DFQ26_006992 [Actinomortierella ambigua]|nr:hypothetical protein DFQ26_006992 [Actinomortierella ambigua]